MGKAPFVYSYVQTRLMGQCNGKSPFRLVHVLKPLIIAIRAITRPLQVQGWGSRTNCINMYVGCFLVRCVLGNTKKTNLKALSELGRLSHVRLKVAAFRLVILYDKILHSFVKATPY